MLQTDILEIELKKILFGINTVARSLFKAIPYLLDHVFVDKLQIFFISLIRLLVLQFPN